MWGKLEAGSSPGTWVLGLDLKKTESVESRDITVGTSTRGLDGKRAYDRVGRSGNSVASRGVHEWYKWGSVGTRA